VRLPSDSGIYEYATDAAALMQDAKRENESNEK
jgi:hypothetical protein